jgi:hypothetical protein
MRAMNRSQPLKGGCDSPAPDPAAATANASAAKLLVVINSSLESVCFVAATQVLACRRRWPGQEA